MWRMCVGFKGTTQPPPPQTKSKTTKNTKFIELHKTTKNKKNLFCSFSTISNSRFCDLTLILQFIEERSETNVVSQLVIKAEDEVKEKQAEKQQIRIVSYLCDCSILSLSVRCCLIQKALGL